MDSPSASQVPEPLADLQRWESYLSSVVNSDSVCRVRTSHLQQTAKQREETYLRRLIVFSREILPKKSLSQQGNVLQRQVLELVKLRRQLVPDGSALHQQAGVFLAIVDLHQAIQKLLEKIDSLLKLHTQIISPVQELRRLFPLMCQGKISNVHAFSSLIQMIRNSATTSQHLTKDWLNLCSEIAKYEGGQASQDRTQSLSSAVQSSFLAVQIDQNDKADSFSKRFGIHCDSFLLACLLKDAGYWLQTNSNQKSGRVHHAELSAFLVSRIFGLQVGAVQIIRQHHEQMQGSGLPMGIRKSSLQAESRLLGVLTRWCDLHAKHSGYLESHHPLSDQVTVIKTACDVLIQETHQQFWEKRSVDLLLDTLGVRELKTEPRTGFQSDAKPNWRIPRPHFLNATRKAIPLNTARNK